MPADQRALGFLSDAKLYALAAVLALATAMAAKAPIGPLVLPFLMWARTALMLAFIGPFILPRLLGCIASFSGRALGAAPAILAGLDDAPVDFDFADFALSLPVSESSEQPVSCSMGAVAV